MNLSDNEKILIQYIKDLLNMLSVMVMFIENIAQAGKWYETNVHRMPFNMRDKHEEILAFLAENYDSPFTVLEEEEENVSKS
jgi:hypothetical protein